MGNRIVGVDFGHGVVRAVEVDDPGTRRERVLRVGAVPLDDEMVVSGEVRDPAAVATTLRQLWSTAGIKTRRVVIGMGNSRVLARDLQVPVRPLPQIREGLRFHVADLLPMPLENAVLDYYPISTAIDGNGLPVYDGMLIAALKDVVLQNAKAIRLAGLELVAVDMIPFALIRSLSDRADAATRAFVDVGATTTIIGVATAGVPEFIRTIPVGGEDITRSLMELGQLTRDQAEQIKRVVGLSAEGIEPRYRPVVELMVARSSELMTAIRDTIQYFSDTRQRRIADLTLTGGGARLGRFVETAAAWARMPAALGDTGGDPDFAVATALATSAAGGRDARPAAAPAAPAPVAPTASTPTPAPAAPASKPPSIWNRPIGGRRR